MKEEILHTERTIRTYTGKYLDVFAPNLDDIDIVDIAHGLAHTCRWSGQCHSFYSVAEHSVQVMIMATDELKLAALLHDAAEAYLTDIPRPIKKHLPGYKAIEDNLLKAIFSKYAIPFELLSEIKQYDNLQLEWEWQTLKINDLYRGWDTVESELQFLQNFDQYYKP